MSKVVGVIPARIGSTRFPGKMLADLGGKPLIARTLEQAQKATLLDEVWLATDNEEIADVGSELGVPVCMTDPNHPSGSDRIAEVVQSIEADLVINLQGDEPFMDPVLVNTLVERLQVDHSCEMATVVAPITDSAELTDPAIVKVVADEHDRALYFSRSLIPFSRDEAPETNLAQGIYLRHLGIYAYRRAFLLDFVSHGPVALEETEKLEQLRALYMGARIGLVRATEASPGIDTPEDLELAGKRLEAEGNRLK